MTPKFEVGEVVLLRSKAHPELDGEYIVREVCMPGEIMSTGVKLRNDQEVGYHLGFVTPNEKHTWAESALRKKHLPGSLSFLDIMKTLKDPSKCQNA